MKEILRMEIILKQITLEYLSYSEMHKGLQR